jgi:hypothetical protein
MQNSYTFTYDASKPLPYGLWLDIPFRTKGATAIRSEAKSRGARYLPHAKKFQWWLPQRRITEETVVWMNKHGLIRGERKAPVFNDTIKWSSLPHGHTFTVVLRLPYEQKDIAKSDGAAWDSITKVWWFTNKNFTETLFDKYAKMQAISSVLARGAAHDINFFTEDDGSGLLATNTNTPVQTMQAFYLRRGGTVVRMLKTGCNFEVLLTTYENGKPTNESSRLSVEDARTKWDSLISDGYVPHNSEV